MIIDHVKNAQRYVGLGPHIDAALEYLAAADLNAAEMIELDDGNVRGRAFTFMTRDPHECNVETHRVYADIHVCLEGCEVIGYADIHSAVLKSLGNMSRDIK